MSAKESKAAALQERPWRHFKTPQAKHVARQRQITLEAGSAESLPDFIHKKNSMNCSGGL